MVFEIFGAVSSETPKLIGASARQAAACNGMYAVSHCVDDWRQRLSVRVLNEASQGMMFEWLRMKSIEHHPPPVKWAYARRKLLLARVPVPAGDRQCTLVVGVVVQYHSIAYGHVKCTRDVVGRDRYR